MNVTLAIEGLYSMFSFEQGGMFKYRVIPEACSVERAPASARLLNNSYDVGFYCSTGERSRALALLNAALYWYGVSITEVLTAG